MQGGDLLTTWERDFEKETCHKETGIRNLREEDRRKKWLSIKREKKIMKDMQGYLKSNVRDLTNLWK